MELFPAIDLMGGRVVRLAQGNYLNPTFYDVDPVEMAKRYEEAGVRWVHVIDLDAAKTGSRANVHVIARMRRSVSLKIQCGGGIRDYRAARARIEAGADRIILGTLAIFNAPLTRQLITYFPGKVALDLAAHGRRVAVEGWSRSAGVDIVACAKGFSRYDPAALIVTDIARDGMLQGPSLEMIRAVREAASVPVIASGGISSLEDIERLKRLGVEGCIIGKALYEQRFPLSDAIRVAA